MDVHDGRMVSIRIADKLLTVEAEEYPVSFELHVVGELLRWRLNYVALFYWPGRGFEDWGYPELTGAGDRLLAS